MQLLQISEPNEKIIDEQENKIAIGIDLGTTNSVIACVRNSKAEVLGPIQPSIYEDIISVKRIMGSNKKISNLTAEEISAKILLKLKKQAEAILGSTISQAVITVPAHFDEAARNATKLAAKLANIEVLRLINEPTAAAIAYGLDNDAEGTYLIYDLGGGTFDVSILRMQKGVFQVIATGGDNQLGGDDIDREVAKHLKLQDNILFAKSAKEFLSHNDIFKHKNIELTKQTLNKLALPFIARTIEITNQTILEAGCSINDIKEIILVGGSTRMPLLKAEIAKNFKQPLDSIDPDITVALGAAMQADALINGSDNLLIDVNSLSLGLEVMGGMNERIINKNTAIPAVVTKYFTTYEDGQTSINFHIVQGEREMAKDCRSLANFELKGIPPMKAARAKVAVTFSIDTDGLLTVSAKEETTNIAQEISVKPTYGLNINDIEEMILKSYEHAAEDIENRQISEEKLKIEKNIKNIQQAIKDSEFLLQNSEKQEILKALDEAAISLTKLSSDILQEANHKLETIAGPFLQTRLNWQLKQILKGKTTKEVSGKL